MLPFPFLIKDIDWSRSSLLNKNKIPNKPTKVFAKTSATKIVLKQNLTVYSKQVISSPPMRLRRHCEPSDSSNNRRRPPDLTLYAFPAYSTRSTKLSPGPEITGYVTPTPSSIPRSSQTEFSPRSQPACSYAVHLHQPFPVQLPPASWRSVLAGCETLLASVQTGA